MALATYHYQISLLLGNILEEVAVLQSSVGIWRTRGASQHISAAADSCAYHHCAKSLSLSLAVWNSKTHVTHLTTLRYYIIILCTRVTYRWGKFKQQKPVVTDNIIVHKIYGLSRQVFFSVGFACIEMWDLLPRMWYFKTGGLSWQRSLTIGFI